MRYPVRKEIEDIKEIRSERALDVHVDADTGLPFFLASYVTRRD
jgi:hypothetical protein